LKETVQVHRRGEHLENTLPARGAETTGELTIARHPEHGRRESAGITRRDEDAFDTVPHLLGDPSHTTGHDWLGCRHGLQDRHRRVLRPLRRNDRRQTAAEERNELHRHHPTDEADVPGRHVPQRASLRPIPGHDERYFGPG
jgi:hypothetical protein